MNKLKVTFAAFAALCSVGVSAAPAQTYTIKSLVFDGTVPYSQQSLEAATGLKPGQTIDQKGLEAVSQKLIDTGAFDDLQARFDGPYKAITIVFKVKPADSSRLLDVGFENFVWFEPAELTAELQKRVPLFNGSVPEAGNEQQAIQDALIQMLAGKGVTATLSTTIEDPAPGRPQRTLDFRIVTPDIRIRSIALQGVAPAQTEQVGKVISSLKGSSYNDGVAGRSAPDRMLALYRDAGYLEAALVDMRRTVTPEPSGRIDVDIAATVQAGEPYHVAKIDWPGSSIISAEQFNTANKLHPGDLASQKALREALAPIQNAYLHDGYMDVRVDPGALLDKATHQVTYSINVAPGEQYHLAAVNTNLPPDPAAKFAAAWKLANGSPYDSTYLVAFLKANIEQPYLQPYSVSCKTIRDPDTHAVTVEFTFMRASR